MKARMKLTDHAMSERGWSRTFDDPIDLPGGGEVRTLRDAGNFIAKLPKRDHDSPAWLAAIEALMLVVEHGGDTNAAAHRHHACALSG